MTAPSDQYGGLGPVFNNTSCAGCHINDGRGRPAESGRPSNSMIVRIGLPGNGPDAPEPVPGFGRQFQDRSIIGVEAEGSIDVVYQDTVSTLADGTQVGLRRPIYTVRNSYTPFPAASVLSPRIAPPIVGMGLLEAVSDADLSRLEDEFDSDGDGISGRSNSVVDSRGARRVGRFGWKGAAPDLRHQTAGAFNEDMGITSSLFPYESCHSQPQGSASAGAIEVGDGMLELIVDYMRTLGVPARRRATSPPVARGETVFLDVGCASCHLPKMNTTVSELALLNGQEFYPYTDLLLHDMGDQLSDGRGEGEATGREWRTAPLWGIGLTRIVSGHTSFLHDGRARTLLEAILWHGGEGAASRDRVSQLPASDRAALISFLESL